MAGDPISIEEYQEIRARSMSERELQDRYVIPAARKLGWMVYHTWNSQNSEAGFPDLVLVHQTSGRIIFAELKSEKGKLSMAQHAWIAALRGVEGRIKAILGFSPVEVYRWRPRDWVNGQIERILDTNWSGNG